MARSTPSGPWSQLWMRTPRRERRGMAWAFVTGILWSVAAVGVPLAAGAAVDYLIADDHDSVGPALLVGMIVALAFAKAFALRIRRYLTFTTAARLGGSLRRRLFASLHARDARFFDETPPAEVLASVGDDTEYVEQFAVIAQVLLNNLVWTTLIVGALLWIDVPLTVVTVVPLTLVLVLSLRFLRALDSANVAMRRDSVGIVGAAADVVTGAPTVKGLGLEDRFLTTLTDLFGRSRVSAQAVGSIRARYTSIIEFVPTLSIVLVLVCGTARIRSGDMSVGDFTAFNAYVVMAVWPLRSTANAVSGASRAAIAVTRIAALEGPSQVSASTAEPTVTGPVRVVLQDLSFGYGVSIVENVDLVVEPGETVVITGATGTGKSTLLRLIAGEVVPDRGSVTVHGIDLRSVDQQHRHRLVAVVTDEEFLFSRSLRANLVMAHPNATDHDVELAAELAALGDVVDRLPEKWDTEVGERAVRLSGGQRQRAALARGYVSPAGLLLLDDVTSALDTETTGRIATSLRELKRRKTVILVSSQPALVAAADRVLVLSGRALSEITESAVGVRR
ncbi:ABC transporter ATP-binding protein [Rhodococcus sp. NPDC056516]|uniref:ABC transporter ATP-binding protein n=1 Tax=Rhodococcus sp. NPDC056516 TaxID=3345847 RepID=UPI0036723038